jgi:hypothetical protein
VVVPGSLAGGGRLHKVLPNRMEGGLSAVCGSWRCSSLKKLIKFWILNSSL